MLRYAGSKYKARHLLHDLAPVTYQEYREPFLGGANMLCEVPATKTVWVNDARHIIVKYWQAVRDDPGFIDRQVAFAEWSKTATAPARVAAFDKARELYDLEDDPFSFWILNQWAVCANVHKTRGDIACMSTIYRKGDFRNVNRCRIESMRDILARPNVTITEGDYLPLLQRSGEGVWIFLDPPYPMKKQDNYLYGEHCWTWADHEPLAEHLRQCVHKWLLTNGNMPRVRALYQGFRIRERRYTGGLTLRQSTTDSTKTELIITNY